MNVSCGTDIIEINRIKDSIEDMGEAFLNRIFTQKEITYCESRKKQKYQHYAARFAAKEAVFRAISILLNDKYSVSWKNIEIQNDEQGRPQVSFIGIIFDRIKNVDISLSHCKEYAVATVVLIYK